MGVNKSPRAFGYRVYGSYLRSPLLSHVPCAAASGWEQSDVAILWRASPALSASDHQELLAPGEPKWFRILDLPDGQTYLRWDKLFEFLISGDGRRIEGRPLEDASWEAFQDYLLGQVLSFAFIKQGIEPLHATVLVRDGNAVGFLGDCGHGKSTLAAAFLQAGYRLLTDDMLVVKEEPEKIIAFPGLPRIKLFPETARSLLGRGVKGSPMNNLTPKLIIPLKEGQHCSHPTHLKALYVLRPPGTGPQARRVTRRTLNKRQAFLALTANTFNLVVRDPDRLKRQFDFATRLAARLPLKSLSYPWEISRLPEVVEKVQKDVF